VHCVHARWAASAGDLGLPQHHARMCLSTELIGT
jgi:hypothetical protein